MRLTLPLAPVRQALTAAVLQERAQVLLEAEVVLCTLSSAGGDLLQLAKMVAEARPNGTAAGKPHAALFDALIIDEAAQAVEPAALIPMQLLRPNSKVGGRIHDQVLKLEVVSC